MITGRAFAIVSALPLMRDVRIKNKMDKAIKKLKLKDIGYSDFFEDNQKSTVDNTLTPARIISEHKELYVLRNETSELSAKITGKMMFTALSREDYPAVGDWVLITILDKKPWQ